MLGGHKQAVLQLRGSHRLVREAHLIGERLRTFEQIEDADVEARDIHLCVVAQNVVHAIDTHYCSYGVMAVENIVVTTDNNRPLRNIGSSAIVDRRHHACYLWPTNFSLRETEVRSVLHFVCNLDATSHKELDKGVGHVHFTLRTTRLCIGSRSWHWILSSELWHVVALAY